MQIEIMQIMLSLPRIFFQKHDVTSVILHRINMFLMQDAELSLSWHRKQASWYRTVIIG